MSSKKKNLDVYLAEIFKEFIAIKDDDFKKSQEVFKSVFEQVKQKMKEQCNFFNKYSSQVMYGGSVYDGIKVSKMDEFDMDIVIRLPINYDDGENGIIIESAEPGFVKLKIIKAFDHLDNQKDWEKCHKVTREWRDSKKYFTQNKFRQWLHGIVQKALNEMQGKAIVNGVTYIMTYKESGPAYTLHIQNSEDDEEFHLDVDLVPVIRFQYPRWPKGYRKIEGSQVKDWLVVPKPNKGIVDETHRNRCWRLSFQDFEREMLKECNNLKVTIRLIKKLRDAQNMKAIASYYIKTLFLWKIHMVKDKKYWQNKISVIFRAMLEEFYNAINSKKIPYFWDKNKNLIEELKPTLQTVYSQKLKAVLDSIDSNDVEKVTFALLTTEEIKQLKASEFYQRQVSLTNTVPSPQHTMKQSTSTLSINNTQEFVRNDSSEKSQEDQQIFLLKAVMEKLDILASKLESQEERLKKLEEVVYSKDNSIMNPVSVPSEVPLLLESEVEINKSVLNNNCNVVTGIDNLSIVDEIKIQTAELVQF